MENVDFCHLTEQGRKMDLRRACLKFKFRCRRCGAGPCYFGFGHTGRLRNADSYRRSNASLVESMNYANDAITDTGTEAYLEGNTKMSLRSPTTQNWRMIR
jgi:hypothetical protein